MSGPNDRFLELLSIDTSVAHCIQGLRAVGLDETQLTGTIGISSSELENWSQGDVWLNASDPKLERLDDLRCIVRQLLQDEEHLLSPEDVVVLLQQPIYDDPRLTLGANSRNGETLLEIIPEDPAEALTRTEYYLSFGSLALKNS